MITPYFHGPPSIETVEQREFELEVLAKDIVLWCSGSVLVEAGPREEQEHEHCRAQKH